MRILVTGARGKVGAATVDVLHRAGHEVTASDRLAPVFEATPPWPRYVQADVSDAGDAFAIVAKQDAVIHAAALPDPQHNPAHVVFSNNLMATFNVIEAAVRLGVPRVVHVSSETVPGFFFAERPFAPAYAPVDEEHPATPQDPYALAKHFGEQLCDAAVARSDVRCISVRPSWVQWEGNVESNLGALVRDPESVTICWNSYVDVYDLAELLRLAAESDLPGHEVFYGAQPDNAGGRPLKDLVKDVPLREHDRPDASGISTAKAVRMLGWNPRRSWRDYLDEEGRLRPEVRERLQRGDTGVHRGRAAGTPA
jgi:nucleoside-diphosphate-sugar epimerase